MMGWRGLAMGTGLALPLVDEQDVWPVGICGQDIWSAIASEITDADPVGHVIGLSDADLTQFVEAGARKVDCVAVVVVADNNVRFGIAIQVSDRDR